MPNPTFVPVIQTGVDVEFGDLAATGTLTVDGASTLTGNVSMGGTLAVTGASTLTGNTTVGGTFGVTGNTTLQGLTVQQPASMNTINASATTLTQLTVSGATALGSTATATLAAAATVGYASLVTADTFDRFRILASGAHEWGSGAAARNIGLSRGADNRLDLTTADFRIATAGRGLQIAEGANAKQGAATLVAGAVTVNTTAVAANSRIHLTVQSLGTVAAPKAVAVTARTAATSFTITSEDATDTSVVAWTIIDAA
jgi:hypothetical protein